MVLIKSQYIKKVCTLKSYIKEYKQILSCKLKSIITVFNYIMCKQKIVEHQLEKWLIVLTLLFFGYNKLKV